MAKEKRPVADLDAELAALEAELAALEGRKPAPSKPAPPPSAPAPGRAPEPAPEPAPAEPKKPRFAFGRKAKEGAAAEASPAAEPAPPAPEPRKLTLPSFGRKKAEPSPVEPAAPPPEPAPLVTAPPPRAAPAPRQGTSIPVTDPTPWRQEGAAWVRAVEGSPTPVVRRILDEEDRVVREESADASALAETEGQEKADKGFGRLFRRRG